MSETVKIAVAEPSLIIRSGLLSVLKRLTALHIEILEIGDIARLETSLSWRKPDILIVDPASLGLFSLQRIKSEAGCEGLRCVALQNGPVDSAVLHAYDAILSVYDTAEQIRGKLLTLCRASTRQEPRKESLSEREKEIVIGVVKGMTNKQIAEHLCLSTHTVITHRRNIASKLQIHSPAGLTIYAIVNKLVELNDIKETIRSREA